MFNSWSVDVNGEFNDGSNAGCDDSNQYGFLYDTETSTLKGT